MTQEHVNHEIYCTNCETVQADSAESHTTSDSVGDTLSVLLEKSSEEELCCYNDECMVEDYTIRKTVSYTDYKTVDLDDANVDIR